MPTHGASIIAGTAVAGTNGVLRAVNPATAESFGPEFTLLSAPQVADATAAAAQAFDTFRDTAPAQRAEFLDQIAVNIEAQRDEIRTIAHLETGIAEAALDGEIGRTTGQLRLFAEVVRQGDFNGVRVDPALPDRTPLPRPDIRQRLVPLGPVAVFGASNFPLAFSTAGGDTASALAAGCPVVFKAHNAHPGTSELVGWAIVDAAQETGIHPGVFSLVYGSGTQIGQQLVADENIAAVGFTGSRAGGLAIAKTAAERRVPIPVYAEMSATNPVFVLPGAITGDSTALAKGFLGSVTNRSGQLCTAPGQLFVPSGEAGDVFLSTVAAEFSQAAGQTMLTSGIAEAWNAGAARIRAQSGVEEFTAGSRGPGENAPAPTLLTTSVTEVEANEALSEEVFGSFALIVRYDSPAELLQRVRDMEGQLTGTIHLGDGDESAARGLVRALELKVGRVLVGGWPTGVDVGHAMVHGGPFPATSDTRTTSVGSLAIERFLRPVAYQAVPDALLPQPLQEANPWNLTRRIAGRLE